MFAVSSQVKLRCTASGDGGAPGCVGSLHTYAWSPPKTECEFREIRTVKGKIGKSDFLAEDGEIYCEITGTLALAGGGNTVFLTNVRDIMLAVNIVLNMCRKYNQNVLHIFRWACRDIRQ